MKTLVFVFILSAWTVSASFVGKSCSDVRNYYSKLDSYNPNKKACEDFVGVWSGIFDNEVEYELNITQESFEEARTLRRLNSLRMSFFVPKEFTISHGAPIEFELGRLTDEVYARSTFSTCNNGKMLSVFVCRDDQVVGTVNLKMKRVDEPSVLEERLGVITKSYSGEIEVSYVVPFMPDSFIKDYPVLSSFKDQKSYKLDLTKQ